jgi:hypothetical protein
MTARRIARRASAQSAGPLPGRYHSLTMMTLGSPNSPQGDGQMNVITLASRKGGESTLTAHVAVYAHLMGAAA